MARPARSAFLAPATPSPSGSPAGFPPAAGVERPFAALLRRLATLALVVVLSFSVVACSGNQAATPPSLSPETISAITRQAEGFLAARDRLPDLAELVNNRNWVFTRNLIHGPMQEVSRQMLYINRLLLPSEQAEAKERAADLKDAMAELDEAARLQDGEALRKAYIKVASGFGLYAQILPEPVKQALNQV